MKCPECHRQISAPTIENDIAYWICGACGSCTEREVISTNPVQRIMEFEQEYGVTLPDSYRDLILPGGMTVNVSKRVRPGRSGSHPLDYYLSQDGHLIVNEIFGVIGEEHETIFCTRYMTAEWDLPSGLVLLEGDGHMWIALDYRIVQLDPPVIMIESEESTWLRIAQNLQSMLDAE